MRLQLTVADRLGMTVTVSAGAAEADPRRTGRVHVTVLGLPLRPHVVSALAGRIAELGANIDRIVRLSSYPVTSVELEVSGADPASCAPRSRRKPPRRQSTSPSSRPGCTDAPSGSW